MKLKIALDRNFDPLWNIKYNAESYISELVFEFSLSTRIIIYKDTMKYLQIH